MNNLIIFDCDGVLLETEILANLCEISALQELGHHFTLDDYLNISVGKQSHQVETILKEQFHITLPAHFWKDVATQQKVIFEKELKEVAGVTQTIISLTMPYCIASNSSLERLHHTLKITALLPHFMGRIFSAEQVARSKPFPDIFLYAAQQMDTDPKQCIVIEDSLSGIKAALAAKMTVLAFGGGQHITPTMRRNLEHSGAHAFFDSMSDLSKEIARIQETII